nr:rod shape-determining protein MreD [uncultured Celeribacter sp.]
MVDPRTVRLWAYRAGFLVLSALSFFLYLLPLQVGTGHWPGPDVPLAFAFAWVLRRPDYIPVLIFAAVMLLADFIFLRPPGLWTALTLVGLEFLRRREPTSRDMPFVFEWAMVAAVMLAIALLNRIVLTLFMVDQAPLGLSILGQISTLIAYPFVVLFSRTILRIEKVTPTEADEIRYAR